MRGFHHDLVNRHLLSLLEPRASLDFRSRLKAVSSARSKCLTTSGT